MKVLILCTGNSCRSKMAEGFLKSFDGLEVYSAGTQPAAEVHPRAIQVMKELGFDLSSHIPQKVDDYLSDPFDYVITVCDDARESCPVFLGEVKHRLHIGFEDPARAVGSDEEVLEVFRKVRDQIREKMGEFYEQNIKS